MPTEIKNLKEAAERIISAVNSKEKIILYGDSDLDGVASVIILEETIEFLGGKATKLYFPERDKDGYGINEKALEYLRALAPALLISLDCGIGNFKEVETAKGFGFEVVIIDHHEILPRVPEASIIVDPKQKSDNYPFKQLSTAGIAYKLSKAILSETGQSYNPESFLELAALATIFDQMPLIDENKRLVEEGIQALAFTKRVGIKKLMEVSGLLERSVEEIRKRIISPLGSAEGQDHLNEAYLLLKEESPERARALAEELIARSRLRAAEIKRMFEEADSRVSEESIIFQGDPNWTITLLGPIASKICQKYKKPAFLFKKEGKESIGAVRMPSGLDGVKAMISCEKLLETYGGHQAAAGFRIKNENLEKFKLCLLKYFEPL